MAIEALGALPSPNLRHLVAHAARNADHRPDISIKQVVRVDFRSDLQFITHFIVAELHFSRVAQSALNMHGVPRHCSFGSKQRVVTELHVPLFEQSALNMHGMPFAVQSESPPLVELLVIEPPMQTAVHSTGLQTAPDLAMHARQSVEAAAQNGGQPAASEQPAAETLAQMSPQESAAVPPVPEPVALPLPAVFPLPVPPAPPVFSLPPQPTSTIIPRVMTRPIARLNMELSLSKPM